ncbi:hypothetical protein Bbelb_039380 [Branchiostoma belcheri]|nr:hypothetical protein Bbelb_039380 [Branchiostoma belcheri]
MDRCLNARHRSSNLVSARKTLATAPAKFVQPQNFRSGRRAPPETSAVAGRTRRCFNGGQLLFSGGERFRAVMNFIHRSRNAIAKFAQCDRALTLVPSPTSSSQTSRYNGRNTDDVQTSRSDEGYRQGKSGKIHLLFGFPEVASREGHWHPGCGISANF